MYLHAQGASPGRGSAVCFGYESGEWGDANACGNRRRRFLSSPSAVVDAAAPTILIRAGIAGREPELFPQERREEFS